MSEEQGTYRCEPLPRVWVCHACHAPIALLVDRDTCEVFKPIAMYWRSLGDSFGYCEHCGARVHWSKHKGGLTDKGL